MTENADSEAGAIGSKEAIASPLNSSAAADIAGVEPERSSFLKRYLRKFGLYFSLIGEETRFKPLARVHALSAAGDAMIILALSNSLFFSIDPSAARIRILLYLLLTIAPFAVVAPLIGPLIDSFKRGRRTIVVLINLMRVVVAFFMISRVDTFLLFPLSFLILVLGKSYSIAKASIVPYTALNRKELVQKNSKLAVLSGVMGFLGIVIAMPFNILLGPSWVITLGAITWGFATLAAIKLPSIKIRSRSSKFRELPPDESVTKDESTNLTKKETRAGAKEDTEDEDGGKTKPARKLHGIFYLLVGRTISNTAIRAHMLRTTNVMAVLRTISGFLFFLIAFGFRGGTDGVDLSGQGRAVGAGVKDLIGFNVETDAVESPLRLLILAGTLVIGSMLGSSIAPKLRRAGKEENILLGGVVIVAISGIALSWLDAYVAAMILGMAVGFSVSAGKVGFDSVAQRDIDEADYGKSFGGFETYFQLSWVVGALIPVVIAIPPTLGFLIIGITAGTTWVIYMIKRKPHYAAYIDDSYEDSIYDDELMPDSPSAPATDQAPLTPLP